MKPHVCLRWKWPNDTARDFDVGGVALCVGLDRSVDDAAEEYDEGYLSTIHEEAVNAIARTRRCKSCGVTGSQWKWHHLPGCALDRSLTANERYALRNPGRNRHDWRKMKIKRRWAILKGFCSVCARRKPPLGYRACDPCRKLNDAAHARMRERQRALAA